MEQVKIDIISLLASLTSQHDDVHCQWLERNEVSDRHICICVDLLLCSNNLQYWQQTQYLTLSINLISSVNYFVFLFILFSQKISKEYFFHLILPQRWCFYNFHSCATHISLPAFLAIWELRFWRSLSGLSWRVLQLQFVAPAEQIKTNDT